MSLEMIPWGDMPGASPLYLKYLEETKWREEHMGIKDLTVDEVLKYSHKVQKREFDRELLYGIFKNYHAQYTQSLKTSSVIDKIKDTKTCFVMTGQQPGIFGGPLYSLYKAISAIKIARELEEKSGDSFIPVFWNASNDHDIDEANMASFVQNDGNSKKIKFNFEGKRDVPLHQLPIYKDYLDFQNHLEEHLPRRDCWQEVLDGIEIGENDCLNDWLTKILLGVLGEEGLLVIEPKCLDDISESFFMKLLDNSSQIKDAVSFSSQKLNEQGIAAQVDPQSEIRLLAHVPGTGRSRVKKNKDQFMVDGIDRILNKGDLWDLHVAKKIELSPDALARPIWQDSVFPSVSYIAGPGEISYFHQLKNAYEVFDLQMPPILPRESYTLLESNPHKFLTIKGIDKTRFYDLLELEGIPKEALASELPGHFLEGLKSLNLDAKTDKELIIVENCRLKIEAMAKKMISKLEKERANNNGIGNRQLSFAKASLFPYGKLQERKLNLYPFLAKYGMACFHELLKEKFQIGKHFVWLLDE